MSEEKEDDSKFGNTKEYEYFWDDVKPPWSYFSREGDDIADLMKEWYAFLSKKLIYGHPSPD